MEPKITATLDAYSSGYEWDTVELGELDGQLYCRSGGGCSCNDISSCPWEKLVLENWADFVTQVRNLDSSAADKMEFLKTAANAL